MQASEYLMEQVKAKVADLEALDKGEYVSDLTDAPLDVEGWYSATVLDEVHMFDNRGRYKGSILTVTLGGPRVDVDTVRGVVTGKTLGGEYSLGYDCDALDDEAERRARMAIENAR